MRVFDFYMRTRLVYRSALPTDICILWISDWDSFRAALSFEKFLIQPKIQSTQLYMPDFAQSQDSASLSGSGIGSHLVPLAIIEAHSMLLIRSFSTYHTSYTCHTSTWFWIWVISIGGVYYCPAADHIYESAPCKTYWPNKTSIQAPGLNKQ